MKTNRITIHWGRDGKCYARIYDANGLMVKKITGYTRVADLKNRAVGDFTDMYPGQYCQVDTPTRWE